MKFARCVIYDPPAKGHPSLAVVFSAEGELLSMRVVRSTDSVDFITAEMMSEVRSAGEYVVEQLTAGRLSFPVRPTS
jgi:hypothetical protein